MGKPVRVGVGAFWLCLAIMYLILAIVSYESGKAYDSKISKAPTMQGTSQGATKLTSPVGSIEFLGSGGQGDVVVTDLWNDLRAYLNLSTWVNVGGFVLAAVAAFVSSASPRQGKSEQREA